MMKMDYGQTATNNRLRRICLTFGRMGPTEDQKQNFVDSSFVSVLWNSVLRLYLMYLSLKVFDFYSVLLLFMSRG